MRAVLDTHVWTCWVTEDPRLSDSSRNAIERACAAGTLWLSGFPIWEVAKKV